MPTCCAARTCRTTSSKPAAWSCMQELRAIEDEPGQKVMLELRRRHYPDPWGRPSQARRRRSKRSASHEIRDFYTSATGPTARSWASPGAIDWPQLRDQVGELFGDWQPLDAPNLPLGERMRASRTLAARIESDANRHRLRQHSVSPSRLFSGLGRRRRAQRRHELAAVHRSPREARPVLQRLRLATTRCAIGAACCAMPAPPPSARRKRST